MTTANIYDVIITTGSYEGGIKYVRKIRTLRGDIQIEVLTATIPQRGNIRETFYLIDPTRKELLTTFTYNRELRGGNDVITLKKGTPDEWNYPRGYDRFARNYTHEKGMNRLIPEPPNNSSVLLIPGEFSGIHLWMRSPHSNTEHSCFEPLVMEVDKKNRFATRSQMASFTSESVAVIDAKNLRTTHKCVYLPTAGCWVRVFKPALKTLVQTTSGAFGHIHCTDRHLLRDLADRNMLTRITEALWHDGIL